MLLNCAYHTDHLSVCFINELNCSNTIFKADKQQKEVKNKRKLTCEVKWGTEATEESDGQKQLHSESGEERTKIIYILLNLNLKNILNILIDTLKNKFIEWLKKNQQIFLPGNSLWSWKEKCCWFSAGPLWSVVWGV